MNNTQIKWIAILTMVIDHVGAVITEFLIRDCGFSQLHFLSESLRCIGRVTLPMFAFLLVEGFVFSKNHTKYLFRLLLLCVISEVPFDLAFHGDWFYLDHQNIFFTLAIGLSMLMLLERVKNPFFKVVIVGYSFILATLLHVDYGWSGILLILIFFLFRSKKIPLLISILFWMILMIFFKANWIYLSVPLCLIPVYLYNGKRGKNNLKMVFYYFYPVHLFLLFILRLLINSQLC